MKNLSKPTSHNVLKNYNFRLLWIGQGTSLLGDEFFMIALPWLVLKLTDDAAGTWHNPGPGWNSTGDIHAGRGCFRR